MNLGGVESAAGGKRAGWGGDSMQRRQGEERGEPGSLPPTRPWQRPAPRSAARREAAARARRRSRSRSLGTGHGLCDGDEEVVGLLVDGRKGLQEDPAVGAHPQRPAPKGQGCVHVTCCSRCIKHDVRRQVAVGRPAAACGGTQHRRHPPRSPPPPRPAPARLLKWSGLSLRDVKSRYSSSAAPRRYVPPPSSPS